MTQDPRVVIGGVDTHKDAHVAAVIDDVGRVLDSATFIATRKGCEDLVVWMSSFGTVEKVGVEGTGAYGAGLNRHLASEGITVVEVNRPNRQTRRQKGKSDTIDAESAARAVLNGEAKEIPKAHDGSVESIRVLRVAFTSARGHRAQVANQIRDLVVTAPDQLRAALGALTTQERVSRCARLRLSGDPAGPLEGTRVALRSLARRYEMLTLEMDELTETLDRLTAKVNPALRSARGVGVDVAGILLVAAGDNPSRFRSESAFASLAGVAPLPASSGKTSRHRLSRSGNRQANHALWRIAMVRLTCDQRTKDYVARRTAEGKSNREIMRCLKRYVAREVFQLLTDPQQIPLGTDLRRIRHDAGVSLKEAASRLGTWPTRISELERGLRFDLELVQNYQRWLTSLVAA
jgi:transposase